MLEAVWKSDRAVTVRHVQLAFPDLAYTTLMKILDRLYRKGMLLRRRRERAFAYEPRCPREAFFDEVVSDQVLELLGAGGISTAIPPQSCIQSDASMLLC